MTQVVRKAAHALAEEGDLLNLYADLKDVAHTFESRVKAQERACKVAVSWSVKEKKPIEDFMTGVTAAENAQCNADKDFNEEFRLFARLWKSILGEKKELNSKVNAFKKATKNLEQARKKYAAADTKQPRDDDKLTKARKSLEAMEGSCNDVEKAMREKMLDVQKQKHVTLRSGYLSLYKAAMARLRVLVEQQNAIRQHAMRLPLVSALTEDGDDFVYEESTEIEERPLWTRGEEMMAELVKLRDGYEQKIAQMTKDHAAKLKQVLRERESSDALKTESYSAEVLALSQKNSATLDALEREHANALDELSAKKKAAEQALNDTISKLQSTVTALEQKLAAKHKKLCEAADESSKLEDTIEALKISSFKRATNQAVNELRGTVTCMEQSPQVNFVAAVPVIRAALAAVAELFTASSAMYAEYDNAMAHFTQSVTSFVLITYALSKSSKAENSAKLLAFATEVASLSRELCKLRHHIDNKRSHPALGRTLTDGLDASPQQQQPKSAAKQAPAENQYVAMYNHEAKEHNGSVLLGFSKGDVLTMLRKRDDGWSKVKKGNEQGWAPTSYLRPAAPEDLEADYEETTEESSTDDVASGKEQSHGHTTAAANAMTAAQVEEKAKKLAAKLRAAIDSLESEAKIVIARDRELATLSNALVRGLEGKVTAAQQSVIDTKNHVTKMVEETQGSDSGRRLEVNTSLLTVVDKLTELMTELIKSADAMRDGLHRTKGMETDDEYNVKHGSWLKGLNDAVDSMVEHNPVLSEALRSVVRKQGKHEELQVSARNLSAAVQQFAALSRSKIFPGSEDILPALNRQAEEFKATAHEILACSRECKDLDLASVMLEDLSNLSENDAKRLVMATQVNVLKLETSLNKEHEKLRRLRRLVNYEE